MEQATGLEIETAAKPIFEEWGIAELMGHRVSAGKLTESHVFGRIFLRIDIPQADGSSVTQLYGPEAIYGLTFTTEDVARSVAADFPIGIQNARIASYLVRDDYDPDAEPEAPDDDAGGEDILRSAAIMGVDPPDYRPIDAMLEKSDSYRAGEDLLRQIEAGRLPAGETPETSYVILLNSDDPADDFPARRENAATFAIDFPDRAKYMRAASLSQVDTAPDLVEAAREREGIPRPKPDHARYSPMVNPNWPGAPDPLDTTGEAYDNA